MKKKVCNSFFLFLSFFLLFHKYLYFMSAAKGSTSGTTGNTFSLQEEGSWFEKGHPIFTSCQKKKKKNSVCCIPHKM